LLLELPSTYSEKNKLLQGWAKIIVLLNTNKANKRFFIFLIFFLQI